MQISRAIGMLPTDPANELVRITRARAKSGPSNGTEKSEAVNAINRAVSRLTRQLRNLATAPEKYDGAADISEWLETFDLLTTESGREENNKKLSFLVLNLAGDALEVYWSLPSAMRKNYETVRTALIENFGHTEEDKHEAKMLLYNRKQKQFEPLKDYVRAMISPSKATDLVEEEKSESNRGQHPPHSETPRQDSKIQVGPRNLAMPLDQWWFWWQCTSYCGCNHPRTGASPTGSFSNTL